MIKEALPEVEDRELEVVPQQPIELNQDKLNAILAFSEQTDRVGKALDRIRAFAMGRALPGDWVQHGDKINVSGPGAERILSSLGLMGVDVTFRDWDYKKDTGTDKNGAWFYWWYSADVEIGGLHLGKIEGRAGSRDTFFGYEDKQWKDLGDVREADIRMAARRGVFKEAIKVALGLRSIPADQAKVLGLDPTKIKKVEFGKRGETKISAAPSGSAVTIKEASLYAGKNKATGKDYVRYDILSTDGAKYSTFDKAIFASAEKAKASGKKVLIAYTVGPFGNTIDSLEDAPASEIGDAQDD